MTTSANLRKRYSQLTIDQLTTALSTIRNPRCADVAREVLVEKYALAADALACHGLGGRA